MKRTISEQLNHPNYDDSTTQNDFMLLRLAQDAPANAVVTLSNDPSDIAAGTPLTVLGLGTTGSQDPTQLMDVEVLAIADAQCQEAYGLMEDISVDLANMFCAGVDGGGKDSCYVSELCARDPFARWKQNALTRSLWLPFRFFFVHLAG